ncbi:MAG: TolB family protein, partial [Woeseiales bacterium]
MTICMRRIRLALPLALILIVANSAFGDNRHLQVADYLEVEQVADAQVSPDGDRIVYTRRWADQKSDRISSALWMMEADGSGHRYLTSGSNARWSPNGDRILFISKGDNDKPQLFVRWMDDGGAESQVTRVEITPSSPKWSPDGQQIAFVAIVPAENVWSIDLPDAPEG